MVDREGQLVAVGRALETRRHQAGVVDEDIDLLFALEQLLGEPAHRVEAREIGNRGREQARVRALGDETAGGVEPGRIAPDHDDAHALAREAERGVEPDPGIGAGDDGGWRGHLNPVEPRGPAAADVVGDRDRAGQRRA